MKYTKHGKLRASERSISEDMILEAVSKPTCTYYDLSTGTTVALKKLDEKHLLVVYSGEGDEIKVLTTFITSDAEKIVEKKLKSSMWVKIK